MSAADRPNHASPWVIDARTLGRRPGSLKAVRLAAPVTEPVGLEVVAVPPGAQIDLDLRLEAVAEGVLVSGTAATTAVGVCSRCLVELTEPVVAQIRELYAYPDSATAATTDDDEVERLVDDLVDLEPRGPRRGRAVPAARSALPSRLSGVVRGMRRTVRRSRTGSLP